MAMMGLEEKLAVLAEHSLLKHVDPGDLSQLAAYATVAQHRPRTIIFRQGDPGSSMMAVLSGRVRICSYSAEGKEVTLNIVRKGEYFGEIALLDGKSRTAEAVAIEETSLLVLERRDFLPFLADRPAACLHLLSVLCARLRQTSQQLEDALFLDLQPRLARCLVRLAERFGKTVGTGIQIDVRLSQQELAAFVGMTRESVNKQLSIWRRDGVVGFSAGTVTIHDLAELRSLSGIDDDSGGGADGP